MGAGFGGKGGSCKFAGLGFGGNLLGDSGRGLIVGCLHVCIHTSYLQYC